MKEKLGNSIYIYILIVFLTFNLTFLQNKNEIINRKDLILKNNELKTLEQEGSNYRLVTSADNVQVPVPKGYVASNITGEKYVTPEYSHTTITHKVSSIPTTLIWSSPEGEEYPWTQDENGIWISGNQGIANSESVLESEEFDYIKGTTLSIKFTYSNQSGDYLNIDLINLTNNTTIRIISNRSGNTGTEFDYTTTTYTDSITDWATGRYKIRAIYSKDSSGNSGQDSAYIKPSTYFKEDENGEIIEEDIKTKIHDGGFVIYQLTDEEIEENPKGTNVIINDTNKETAQSTRNQYVWVPVENVEDVVRAIETNNGIMQFGQGYRFSDSTITKLTGRGDLLIEPRLVESYDREKYHLQKYIDINNRQSYLNNMQDDFTRMIESINKYKGFYIGRYETGDDYTHSSSKGCFISPKVVRYNSNIDYVTWYDSYKDLQRLSGKTEKYVETGMIYDTLWDYTLKWLNETDTKSYEEIAVESTAWGNYMNNSFKYKLSAKGIEYTKNVTGQAKAATGGITELIYKGEIYNDSSTVSNSIFDLAGNVCEYTRSRMNFEFIYDRGGAFYNYNRESSVGYSGYSSPKGKGTGVGVRAQLYIL